MMEALKFRKSAGSARTLFRMMDRSFKVFSGCSFFSSTNHHVRTREKACSQGNSGEEDRSGVEDDDQAGGRGRAAPEGRRGAPHYVCGCTGGWTKPDKVDGGAGGGHGGGGGGRRVR